MDFFKYYQYHPQHLKIKILFMRLPGDLQTQFARDYQAPLTSITDALNVNVNMEESEFCWY